MFINNFSIFYKLIKLALILYLFYLGTKLLQGVSSDITLLLVSIFNGNFAFSYIFLYPTKLRFAGNLLKQTLL